MAPPNKSPRTGDFQSHVSGSEGPEVLPGTAVGEEAAQCPPKRRKSYRRASLARRSLAPVPDPCQNGTLEELMEASMKLALKKLRDSLQSEPNFSLEAFEKRVDSITRECASLADTPDSEEDNDDPSTAVRSCDPEVQASMDNMRKAINMLKAENDSWEALLDKHRSKAKELQRKVAEGPLITPSTDNASLANSSQYQLIKDKPDYRAILSRQQPVLQKMELIMDTQSKMVRELMSIKEQSQLIVKETSRRLANAAGFYDQPHDPIRKLLEGPVSSEAP